ncbi:MAG TPA: T9SS type B sorting domain-containing protein, partial [Flavobacteriales bacterium]|nr:T9SS type B sorting domain-containing protein [Flavobacteriales bacterium]
SATVTDSAGCIANAIVSISEPAPLSILFTPIDVLCFGDCNGSITTNVSGGTPPYTYLWNDLSAQTDSVAVGLCSGNYTVYITDINGCIDSSTSVVNTPTTLTLTFNSVVNVSCSGLCDGQVNVSVSGGVAPLSFLWGDPFGQTDSTAIGLCAGNIIVLVTNGNGCTLTDSMTITEPAPLLVLGISLANESCPGSCDGSASATVSGGSTSYTYLWNDGSAQTTLTASALCGGLSTLAVTDSQACMASDQVLINTDPLPIINAGNDTTLCPGACVTLNTNGGIQYAWSPGTGLNDSTIANPIACPSITTTYVVTGSGTGSNLIVNGDFGMGNTGFTSSYGFNSASPGFYYVDTDPSVYNSGHSGSDNTSGSGNFLIVDGATTSNTNVWCQTVTVLPNTNYTFSAWLNNIILTTNNFTDPTLQFTINGAPLCASLTLPELPDVWVQIACSWNSGVNTFVTICLYSMSTAGTGNDFGVDDISFTGPSTCFNTDTVTIFVAAPMTVNTSTMNESCVGACDGTVLASVAGGATPYTFLWDNGAGTDSIGVALCDTNYTVVVTDSIGCSSTNSATVSSPPPIVLDTASVDASCGNADGAAIVIATGGTGAYTYLWDDGNNQTTSTANGLAAGGYTVIVSDGNGCSASIAVPVNDAGSPTASILASINVVCNADSTGSATVTAFGGTPPYTYLWDDPMNQTSTTAVWLSASTYIATVTDSIGCVSNAVIVITEPTPMLLSVSSLSSSCGVANGSASVVVSGANAPYTYSWNDTQTQTNDTAQALFAGNYTVIITDSSNCVDSVSVTVANISGVVIQSIANVNVSCNGQSDGQATVSAIGGTMPYTYLWDAGTGNQTDSIASNLGAGSYSVTVTDSSGCISIGNVAISEPFALNLATNGVDANCGFNDGQVSVTVTGGTTPYTYLWDDPLAQTNSVANSLLAATYAVVVMDSNGCIQGATVVILDIAGGTAQITAATDASCFGYCDGTLQANMVGGLTPFTYLWSDNQNTATAVGLCSGSYSVVVIDATGCTSTVNGLIVEPGPVLIQGNGTPASCSGASDGTASVLPLGSITPYSYLWDASTGSQTTASVDSLPPGDYSVLVTDGNGCLDSLKYSVVLDSLSPTAYFVSSDDTVGLLSASIDFTNMSSPSLNSLAFQWDFGDGATDSVTHPTHTYNEEGTFPVELIVSNTSGCQDTFMLFVTIEGDYILFAPNTFTPNGDGINDLFFPKGVGIDENTFKFYIYDRWGDQIFTSTSMMSYWDGRANEGAVIAQEDVYVWLIITTEASSGEHHQYVGHVTLIR